MSEKQKEALERLERAIQNIPESKLEYLQGYADAMDDMNRAARKQEQAEETELADALAG